MDRILRLAGASNLRDVGGYPTIDGRRTRWRTLYRSDCPDRLDAAGQAFLINEGLRSIIDLRGANEFAERAYTFASTTGQPERMLLTLQYIESEYDGVREYLLRHGLEAAALESLVNLLTEVEWP